MNVTDQDSAVRDVYERLIRAWNDREPDAFAELFADDGVMIGFDGSLATGQEVRDHLEPIFRDHPTASYVAAVAETRAPCADVMLLRARVGMVPRGATELNPAGNAWQSLVVTRRDGRWSILLFQNTPARYDGRPEIAERHTTQVDRVRAAGKTIG